MNSNKHSAFVKTRFLILSDTHGMHFRSEDIPSQHADVAIHCGDLTEESKLEEYEASIRLLKDIHASLKLVIAGNHDFTMDIPTFRKKIADARPSLDPDLVRKVFGDYGSARRMFEDARAAGIIFLDEGNHYFVLENGAILSVYASPWTPSLGDWGFQYAPRHGHNFEVAEGIDLVITHGPPKGIMDYTESKQRAGCPNLFRAIARARPRLHCFGHIHEGWGAKLVTWRDQLTETPSHFTDIDNERSVIVGKLSGFRQSIKAQECWRERCCTTTHCLGDAHPLEFGKQTLFVNAAIEGTEEHPFQMPWFVELELLRDQSTNVQQEDRSRIGRVATGWKQ